ncbi:MAG: fibronectin type III domain-containing protein [Saccharospirillum sp.]|nr:fibronectin type III domain-containing protein [Saccharospirillum sp.]
MIIAISAVFIAGCGSDSGETRTHSITANANEGGTVSPESIEIEEGQTTDFTITADTYYQIASVSGCDGNLDQNTYTTGSITEACEVLVSFEPVNLAAPENLTGEADDGQISFAWDEAGDATGYILAYNTDPDVDPSNPGSYWVETAATEYTLEGLDNGTTYYAVVTAVIEDVTESETSNEVSVLVEPQLQLTGYVRVEERVDLDAGGYVVRAVECPAGLQAFSGGVRLDGESGQTDTRIQRSNPGIVGSETSAWATGVSNESNNDYEALLYAVCAEAPEGLEVITDELTMTAGSFTRAITACSDPDHVVYGGGFRIHGFVLDQPDVQLQYSRPSMFSGVPSQWAVGIANKSAESRTFDTYSVCAPPTRGYTATESTQLVGPGSFARMMTWCETGQIALSGGVLVPGAGSSETFTETQYEYRSSRGLVTEYGWTNGFLNDSAESHNLTTYAICSDP